LLFYPVDLYKQNITGYYIMDKEFLKYFLNFPVISRRDWLKIFGFSTLSTLAFQKSFAGEETRKIHLSSSNPSPYWTSQNPFAYEPQKLPLIRLNDRPIVLETPREFFEFPFTPNAAFYVRYHLDGIPNSIDLSKWRLYLEGNFSNPISFSFADLLTQFEPVSVVAVNQCSGNSRSRFYPRVPGAQWGNGAMGNAKWTGVRLIDVLQKAKIKPNTVQIQFQGFDYGRTPEGTPAHAFIKSLDRNDPILEETLLAYAMNGEPLPLLNGFPLRLVVPGKFATYWIKHLTWIRALETPDTNFWMKTAYRIPKTNGNSITFEEYQKKAPIQTIPIGDIQMPVRSFIIQPTGDVKLVEKMGVQVKGIAFSGYGRIVKVEFSADGGSHWQEAMLERDLGKYSFRLWHLNWTPRQPGEYLLASRAWDEKGNTQPTTPIWNPGGYCWNTIEIQKVWVGKYA